MKTLGIVGDICAGKTTIAKKLTENKSLKKLFTNGIIYIEGDAEIGKMYKEDSNVIKKIESVYPECIVNGCVDTKVLGKFFFANKENQKLIESITHPALKKQILSFINLNAGENILFILDVPVLFKLEINKQCDYIVFFTANQEERVERGIKRMSAKHNMTNEEARRRFLKINNIAAKQEELKTNITIDTTNYKNNPEFTISNAVQKIVDFLLYI